MSGRNPYEVYAKYILEAMYGDRYGTLLLRDKPDLQTVDGESGIEVMSVNGKAFECLMTEMETHEPYQAPTDRILELCEENKAPISYHYVYIDTAGRLACFDLAHGEVEVRSTDEARSKFLANPVE